LKRIPDILDSAALRWAVALLLFTLAVKGPVSLSHCDAYGTLLTAHSLVTSGDLTLDEFESCLSHSDYRVFEAAGHAYYFFPPGSSLLAVPFVWLGASLGIDPTAGADDRVIQLFMAALFLSGNWCLLFRIARHWLPALPALSISLLFILGTGAVSTLATGFWNQAPALFLVLMALFLLIPRDRPRRDLTYLLPGLLIGFAVWCRPTTALALLGVFLIPGDRRRARLACLAGFGGMVVGLFLFSHHHYDLWLPPYFRPNRLASGAGGSLTAVLGNLVSPSRGLLVTSLFLVPTLAWAAFRARALTPRPVLWVGVVWTAVLVLWVGRFGHWWGGYCFGNRLLIDALPPLYLITVLVLKDALNSPGPRARRTLVGVLFLTGLFSIWLNVCQGLYNPASARWCGVQDIDHHPDRLWSWSEAQWRANQVSITSMAVRNLGSNALRVVPGEAIRADAKGVVFESLHSAESTSDGTAFRWSDGDRALIVWRQGRNDPATPLQSLSLTLGAYGPQRVTVALNGLVLGVVELVGFTPEDLDFSLPPSLPDPGLRFPEDCLILELKPDRPEDDVAFRRKIGVSFWRAVTH